jgi:hypothetical protein
VNDTPADILRRARPIPTFVDRPSTVPHDVVGHTTDGHSVRVDVVGAAAPVLLLFLSADCLGCADLWEGLGELQAGLGGRARLAVVTRGPETEDAGALARLAGPPEARPGVDVVMSPEASRDFRVGGAPFFVVVAAGRVVTEGVAWGLEQTLRTALGALPDS